MFPTVNSKFLPDEPNQRLRRLTGMILFLRGEPDKFITHFHEDAVWHVIGKIADYSYGGVYRGHDEILALLRRIDSEIALSDHRILNIVVERETIAIRRTATVRHHGTAAVEKLFIGNFARFRGDRIAEAYEYLDTDWLRRLSGDDSR